MVLCLILRCLRYRENILETIVAEPKISMEPSIIQSNWYEPRSPLRSNKQSLTESRQQLFTSALFLQQILEVFRWKHTLLNTKKLDTNGTLPKDEFGRYVRKDIITILIQTFHINSFHFSFIGRIYSRGSFSDDNLRPSFWLQESSWIFTLEFWSAGEETMTKGYPCI